MWLSIRTGRYSISKKFDLDRAERIEGEAEKAVVIKMKIVMVIGLAVLLAGCSYSAEYLKGQPMSPEQRDLIRQTLEDGTIHKGMTKQEVYDILGPAQKRFMSTWTYYEGRVDYVGAGGGSGLGDRWQFNFDNRDGKLNSVWYTPYRSFLFRRVLKEQAGGE